jgi:Rad3-related DNA helicase
MQPSYVTASQFRSDVVQQYPDADDIHEAIERAVEDIWPAPGFREHQQETIVEAVKALYVKDYDVVTLSAPTGAGKSLIINAVSSVISKVSRANSFITTPLNALIDQIENDELLNNLVTIKGKSNYNCTHPADSGASVDDAVCQREKNFKCRLKDKPHTNGGCPYYGRKMVARQSDIAVTNLSYLMANSMIPESADAKFEPRDFLAIDEVQNVENFALQFIGFKVSEKLIPIDFDHLPEMPGEDADMDRMVSWLRDVLSAALVRHQNLKGKEELTKKENKRKKKLKKFQHRLSNFLEDYDEGRHWTRTYDYNEKYDEMRVEFEPIFIGRFLHNFLWGQANKVMLSSATIPKGSFIGEIGLGDEDVYNIEVPSTFPKERRPVITNEMVGKMTQAERDETIPEMAEKIADIADAHSGEKGFIHCNSYRIAQRLYDNLPTHVQDRSMVQDQEERDESLDRWLNNGKQVFFSVAMDEGISLDGERCRWQVVAKASYPFMGDERVSYRLDELGDWQWYANQAIINLQQAVGRGMRSKDDYCATYLLDSSFDTLIDRNKGLFEDWFLDSIDCENDVAEYDSSPDFTF